VTLEQEAKFDVDRDYDDKRLRASLGDLDPPTERRLRTAYFDSSDGRLARLGLSLRHRREDAGPATVADQGTWTLKVPQQATAGARHGVLSRREYSCDGGRGQVPADLLEVLRGSLRRAQLVQLVELETTRRRSRVHGGDKRGGDTHGGGREVELAELDDDRVHVVGGPNDGLEFRQVEIEFKRPNSPEAKDMVAALRRSGATPTQRSKLSIALGAPTADRHEKARRNGTKSPSVGKMLAGAVGSGLGTLLEYDLRLRLSPLDPAPEDVHQARVAARRLRSHITLCSSLLDPVWLDHMVDDLRWLGSVLGRVRDLDVRCGTLVDAGAETTATCRSEREAIVRALHADRHRAVSELREALSSKRYLHLLDRLEVAEHWAPFLTGSDHGVGPHSAASNELPSLVGHEWRVLRRKVRQAGSHPDDESLHKIRIKAKRLRYAAELAAPIVGKPAARTAQRAKDVQTMLGDLHDTVTAEHWLRAQAPDQEPTVAFAMGALGQQQRDAGQDLRLQWRKSWKKLRRHGVVEWME